MAILREDGRLSNREVARRLDVSEGTVRQRLKKLQDAGAIRIGVVTDANRVGFAVSAWVRVSVAPEHVDHALQTFTEPRRSALRGGDGGALQRARSCSPQ